MRKLAAGVIVAAIALMIAATPSTDHAQQAVATPSGEALQAKAERVRDAFLKGSPEEFMAQFAPWIQGRATLLHAEDAIETKAMTDKDRAKFEKYWSNRGAEPEDDVDPSDMLKIKTADDLLKMTVAQNFSARSGYYRVRGGAVTNETLASQWHLVDRSIGFEQYQEKAGKSGLGSWLSRTRGKIAFMTPETRDGFIVTCVAEGDSWQVIDFEYKLGNEKAFVSERLGSGRWDVLVGSTRLVKQRRKEAEAMLGSFHAMARVAFAKLGEYTNIKRLTGAVGSGGCGVDAEELNGVYSSVVDKVAPQKESFKLMTRPGKEYEEVGYCASTCKWSGGNSTFTWYDTLEDLHAAHPEFK